MTTEHEIRCVMRARLWEVGDVIARQSGRVGQSHVTRRARFARDVYVGGFVPVTINALIDDGVSHRHPWRAALVVTGGAIPDQCTVGGVLRGCCAAVCLVCEAPIPRAWARTRLPLDSPLDNTVVTPCTRGRLGKHRLPRLDNTGMAGGAQWEHLGVLLVGERSLRPLPRLRRGEQRARDQSRRRHCARGEPHREPRTSSHRSSGRAGGSRM